MRKMLLFILAALLFVFNACNNATEVSAESTSMNAAAEKNLASFNMIADAFSTGDTSKIDSLVSPEFVDHTERGNLGRDSLKATIAMVQKMMPGMKSEPIKQLADSEYVFALRRYSGPDGLPMGMAPGPYAFNTMEVV